MRLTITRALNFQESMEETAKFSKYLFTAPNPLYTGTALLLVSVLTGFLFFYPDERSALFGLAIFGIPGLLAGLLTKLFVVASGGKIYFRRSFLLALLSMAFPVFFGILWRVLSLFTHVEMIYALIISPASIVFFRHFVIYAIATPSHPVTLPNAIIHTVLIAIPMTYLIPLNANQIVVLIASTALFLLASAIFMEIVSYPMQRFFGVKAGALVKPLLDHLTEKDVASASALEKFLDSFASKVNVYMGVIGIKSKGGVNSTLIVAPAVHPGPFSMIGGGNLPEKVRQGIKNWKNIMVPHGTATHDFNLTTTEECKKVSAFASELADKLRYSSTGSEFVRVSDRGFTVCAQMFGDTVLVVATSAPNPTDDIDYPTGLHAVRLAESIAGKAILVDAHNCLVKGSGAVRLGMERADVLLENVEKAVRAAIVRKGEIKAGYCQDRKFQIEEGIGPQGVQVLCVECNGKKNAYVLVDGNNMVPGLREKIIKGLEGIVDDAEVLTTDNHIVNATFGGFNPVGKKIDHAKIVTRTRELVKRCITNMEPVEVGGNVGILKGVRVFGHETAPRLTTVMNTTYSMIWPILGAMFLLPTFLSFLLMFLFI